jgi:hypothetical protein
MNESSPAASIPETLPGHYAVGCPACQAIFLVPDGSLGMGVQCPYCAVGMMVPAPTGTHQPAVTEPIPLSGEDAALSHSDVSQQNAVGSLRAPQVTWRTHAQELAEHLARQGYLQGRALAIIGGTLAVIAGVSIWAMVGRSKPPLSVPAPPDPVLEIAQSETDITAAWEVAEKFLLAPNWPQALPYVRQAERVQKLMQSYHDQQPWRTFRIEDRRPSRLVVLEGLTFAELRFYEGTTSIPLRLEKTATGFKVDWEDFVRLDSNDWKTFFGTRSPGVTMRLRANVRLGSASDAMVKEAGLDPTSVKVLRLHGPEEGDSVLCLLRPDSDLLTQLPNLSFEVPQPWIIDVEMSNPASMPPLASLHGLHQPGWIYKDAGGR